MSIQTPERIVHVGQTDQLSGFAIPHADYAQIGDVIFPTIADQQRFPFASLLFSGHPTTIDGLNAYLLLEELEQIADEVSFVDPQKDQFTMIYNNVKYQVYNCNVATVTFS